VGSSGYDGGCRPRFVVARGRGAVLVFRGGEVGPPVAVVPPAVGGEHAVALLAGRRIVGEGGGASLPYVGARD